ncbi:DUF4870 domain-containing protein [Cellvibrio mixtus]|uniref:DUF4870 domain-containing protein n=1 Tax=Cellvibrio mixtus TaxID=39650 RepID=UPI0006941CD1|nr:DUF4870 domain-containing protein [Cellvibrio mixtus]
MDLDQIEKLNDLKQKGLITEEEYQQAKERILGAQASAQANAQVQPHTIMQTNNYDYAMVLHLTQFCSWLFPFLGIIVPLIMWQSKKDDAYVDQQGRVVMNWVFSAIIYAIVGIILCFVVIGIPLLILLFICSIVFTIMGAIDANKGIIKNYPLTIKFFDVKETPRPGSADASTTSQN